jgi:hypothetical protein
MGKINMGRVILGGLLAGLVVNIAETILNVIVIAGPMEEALKARNLPPIAGGAIGGFVVLCFILGIVTVWLYAAMRPRFGPGVGTAVKAAVAVWFLAFIFPGFGSVLMGFYPAGVMGATLLWELAEIVVAAIAGAWLYRE